MKIFCLSFSSAVIQRILLFHTGEAIVRCADHHDSRSGDGGVGQGRVIHEIGGEKNKRKLVGFVENHYWRITIDSICSSQVSADKFS